MKRSNGPRTSPPLKPMPGGTHQPAANSHDAPPQTDTAPANTHPPAPEATVPVDENRTEPTSETTETTPQETSEPDSEPPADSLPLPTDDAEWTAVIRSIPENALLALLRKDKRCAEQLLKGFRPNQGIVNNPFIMKQLLKLIRDNPALATAILELAAKCQAVKKLHDETPKPPAVRKSGPTQRQPRSAPSAVEESLRQRIKELTKLKSEVQRDIRAAETETNRLRDQIAKLKSDIHNLKDEIATRNSQLQLEIRKVRTRDRQLNVLRKDLEQAKREPRRSANPAAETQPAISSVSADTTGPWIETIEDLMRMGRDTAVVTFTTRLVTNPALPALERAQANRLLARTLRKLRDHTVAIEAANNAATDFLDTGSVVDAMDCLFEAIAHAEPNAELEGCSHVFTRILKFAERNELTEAVVDRLRKLRILNRPIANRVANWPGLRVPKRQHLWTRSEPPPPSRTLAPDETIALPSQHPCAAHVSPRAVVKLIAAGNTEAVDAIRDAMDNLPVNQQGLATAFADAVETLEPGFRMPLLGKGRGRALIDASNVTRFNPNTFGSQDFGTMLQLVRMREVLMNAGYFPVLAIADNNLRFIIDEKTPFQSWLDDGSLQECGPGTIADVLLIREARETNALLVTNDHFNDHGDTDDLRRAGFGFDHRGRPYLT